MSNSFSVNPDSVVVCCLLFVGDFRGLQSVNVSRCVQAEDGGYLLIPGGIIYHLTQGRLPVERHLSERVFETEMEKPV